MLKTLARDCVIEISLPDGKHWFYGIALVGKGQGAMYMNDWRMDIHDLKPGKGVFTLEECIKICRAINMDGTTIKSYQKALTQYETEHP